MEHKKLMPNTREEAFANQFEDDVKILKSLSVIGEDEFKKHLSVLQAHIDAYNNSVLRKRSEELKSKYKEHQKKMIDKGLIY